MVPKPELHITKVLIPVTTLPSVCHTSATVFFIILMSHCVDFLSFFFFSLFFFVCQGILGVLDSEIQHIFILLVSKQNENA